MSRGEDKRLRATVVLLGALAVEIYWLKFRVVPQFVELYADFVPRAIPELTRLVFGWTPYVVALALAPLPLILAVRGVDGGPRWGNAAIVLAAALLAGLGVGVIGALYLPLD